ncbi:hypothetical protein JCM10450v2_000980 [Rhodotorula kratochvilovae]
MPARCTARESVGKVLYADPDSSSGESEIIPVSKARSKNTGPGAAKKRASKKRPAESSDDESDYDSDDDFQLGRKKKQMTAKGKAGAQKKRATKPNGKDYLSSLPVDALTEICDFLDPLSLVSLRMVNKALLRFLTEDLTAGVIWKRALAAEGLPKLKAGLLTGYQLALMELKSRCIACGNVQWIPDRFILRRLCRTCRKATMVRLDRLRQPYPDLHPLTKLCILPSHFKASRLTEEVPTRWALLPDLLTLDARLWALQAADDADASLNPAVAAPAKEGKPRGLDPAKPAKGGRVETFVEGRKATLLLVEKDARALMRRNGKFIKSRGGAVYDEYRLGSESE